MNKGEIVLVKFPFTDLSGSKLRPAMVLAERGKDVLAAFISSNTESINDHELLLEPDNSNRLKLRSKLNLFKLAAIRTDLVVGRIGNIDANTLNSIDKKLVKVFNINI
jgi:mRNA interferase MazF